MPEGPTCLCSPIAVFDPSGYTRNSHFTCSVPRVRSEVTFLITCSSIWLKNLRAKSCSCLGSEYILENCLSIFFHFHIQGSLFFIMSLTNRVSLAGIPNSIIKVHMFELTHDECQSLISSGLEIFNSISVVHQEFFFRDFLSSGYLYFMVRVRLSTIGSQASFSFLRINHFVSYIPNAKGYLRLHTRIRQFPRTQPGVTFQNVHSNPPLRQY